MITPGQILVLTAGHVFNDECCFDADAIVKWETHIVVILGIDPRRRLPFVLGPTFVGWVLFDWNLKQP